MRGVPRLLAAQQPAPTPTFRTTTRLVELTVTALDKKGQAVTDLQLEDFTVKENGKPRPIAFFKYDGGPPVEPKALPLPAGVFTNRVEFTPGPPRNITALVLDELNTPPQYSMRVRAMVTRYLKALAPQTRVAVFHMGARLRVLHDFTDDADSLRARIEKSVLAMPLQAETDFERSVIEAEQFVDMFSGRPADGSHDGGDGAPPARSGDAGERAGAPRPPGENPGLHGESRAAPGGHPRAQEPGVDRRRDLDALGDRRDGHGPARQHRAASKTR